MIFFVCVYFLPVRHYPWGDGAGVKETLAPIGTECTETEGETLTKNATVMSHKRSSLLKSSLFIWLLFVGSSLINKTNLSFFLHRHLQPMLGPHQPSGSSSNSSAVSGSAVVSGGVGGDCIGGGSTGGGGGGGLVGCGRGRGLNLKMKFVCGQCWREGQVNEPDKSLKYCTAKARHRLASYSRKHHLTTRMLIKN